MLACVRCIKNDPIKLKVMLAENCISIRPPRWLLSRWRRWLRCSVYETAGRNDNDIEAHAAAAKVYDTTTTTTTPTTEVVLHAPDEDMVKFEYYIRY